MKPQLEAMEFGLLLGQGIAAGGGLIGAIWIRVEYTMLLCFVPSKTVSLSKSIWGVH